MRYIRGNQISESSQIRKSSNIIKIIEYPNKSDPTHSLSFYILSDLNVFCREMLKRVKKPQTSDFFKEVQSLNQKTEASLQRSARRSEKSYSTGFLYVAELIEKRMSSAFGLFLANSMSVRLIDNFTALKTKEFPVGANRGVSGIDGNIASAIGFASAHQKPVILLIGDLAFLHDLNSLSLLKPKTQNSQSLIIFLLNDNGGGIFSELKIAKYETYKHIFKEVFTTPQNLTFRHSASQFDLEYFLVEQPNDRQAIEEAYKKAVLKISEGKSSLIEILIDK